MHLLFEDGYGQIDLNYLVQCVEDRPACAIRLFELLVLKISAIPAAELNYGNVR